MLEVRPDLRLYHFDYVVMVPDHVYTPQELMDRDGALAVFGFLALSLVQLSIFAIVSFRVLNISDAGRLLAFGWRSNL